MSNFVQQAIKAITGYKVNGSQVSVIPDNSFSWNALSYSQLVSYYTHWVHIAVDKIAKSFAMLPLHLYYYQKEGKAINPDGVIEKQKSLVLKSRGDENEGKVKFSIWLKEQKIEKIEVLNHPMLDLLKKPNNLWTRYMFWYSTLTRMELTGSCGWLLNKNRLGMPVEMWTLPLQSSGELKCIPDPQLIVKGWTYTDGTVNKTLTPDDMVWLFYPNPSTPFEGMSPLKAQWYPYNIGNYIELLQNSIFKNKAIPGLIFSTEKDLNPDQVDEIVKSIKEQHGGAKKAGGSLVLHSGFKVDRQLSENLSELDLSNVERSVRDKLLSSYDVPAGKVGLVEQVNYANMEALQSQFMQECIKPKCVLVSEIINARLVPFFDDRLICEFELPPTSDKAFDLEKRDSDLEHGRETINEQRAQDGKDPVDWGDRPWFSFSMAQPGETSPGNKPPKPAPDEPPAKQLVNKASSEYWTTENREKEWKAFAHRTEEYEIKFVKLMHNIFADQLDLVLVALEDHGAELEKNIRGFDKQKRRTLFKDSDGKDGVTKAGDNPKLDKFNIDKAAEVKKLRKEAEPIYKYILAESGQARMDSLLHIRKSKAVDDGAYDYNINDPAVREWLGDRLDEFSDEVTGTTFDEIKAVLREGWTEGKPLATIEASLREKFAGFEQYRAQLIARTETIASANKADVDAVRQAGLEDKLLKSWLTSRDGAVRETHLKAEQDYAEGIPLDEDFKVGDDSMDVPGNGSIAEECINCRCTTVYIEKGE